MIMGKQRVVNLRSKLKTERYIYTWTLFWTSGEGDSVKKINEYCIIVFNSASFFTKKGPPVKI